MSQNIELRDEIFNSLRDNAAKVGVTPELWVEMKILEGSNGELRKISQRRKDKAWKDFIGAGDRIPASAEKRTRTGFGQGVANKLRKQGLTLGDDID